MHKRAMITAPLVTVFLAILGLGAASVRLHADALSGSWRLESYTGKAAAGPASGLMIFADDRFSMVYTMEEAGEPKWGRAHAGSYRVEDNTLILSVTWSMEYVAGRPSVAVKPSERRTRFRIDGDSLTITFDNGAVQKFTRARAQVAEKKRPE